MKKVFLLIPALVLVLFLCSCAATPESSPSEIINVLDEKAAIVIEGSEEEVEELTEEKTISVHLYEDEEKTLDLIVTDELCELFSCDWKEVSGKGDGEKVISFTVEMQHEITFFDNGTAMVYYGYCSVLEKDRRYFEITLDAGLNELYNFARENGTEPEKEESGVQIEF